MAKKKLPEGFFPFDAEDRKRTKRELDDTIRIERDAKKAWRKRDNDEAAERKTRRKHPLHPKRVANEVKYQGKRIKKLLIGK
jgi:hypothetical protein